MRGNVEVPILDNLNFFFYVPLALLFVYVLARVVTHAYFESKRNYLGNFFKGDSNGSESRQEDEEQD